MSLDPVDQRLLDLLQEGLPLAPRPFALLGEKLGLDEAEVIKRLASLKERGILRHLGASPDSRRLGFVTTLCAVAAPEERREEIARQIASWPQVTHCYLRRHRLNVWFTLVAKSFEEVEKILKEIERETGLKARHFPATKMFKLRATFRLAGDARKDS
ncbi:MAG: Lrp/AsnC family transcriptional regulator [Thermodesulfobacteria bacterium]|nr:Lrp/AsnC family transcriptional regulator [Thermodesulfobacteriota bacterium]